jgi:putative ABC transport system permease protein
MQSLLRNLRFGARMLVKNPGFTIATIMTLALGIGANTAIFTVTSALLLRPFPYHDPEQLVSLTERDQTKDREVNLLRYELVRDSAATSCTWLYTMDFCSRSPASRSASSPRSL